jgi:hypothetical protein
VTDTISAQQAATMAAMPMDFTGSLFGRSRRRQIGFFLDMA